MNQVIYYLAAIIAVILVFAPHEFAHALVAYKCGDPTAKMNGRLTLNPLKHIDIYGFVLCAIAGFGWAKPVPINPYNFKNYRLGLFLTSIAGVVANFIIAFIAYPIFLAIFVYADAGSGFVANLYQFGVQVFLRTYTFSLSVFMFNLLPLNPLDGFRVVEALTREINPVHKFLKNYGQYILIVVVVESFLCGILEEYTDLSYVKYFDILGYVRWFALNIIGFPIRALWDNVLQIPAYYVQYLNGFFGF